MYFTIVIVKIQLMAHVPISSRINNIDSYIYIYYISPSSSARRTWAIEANIIISIIKHIIAPTNPTFYCLLFAHVIDIPHG